METQYKKPTQHQPYTSACGWIPCLGTIHSVAVTFVHVYS
jgi:hypothetical protein